MSDTPAARQPAATLFRNVRIFDGHGGDLSGPSQVLVRDTKIEQISTEASSPTEGAQAAVIDGGGRVLMPGLIDAHWHAMFSTLPVATAMTADSSYVHLVAGRNAAQTLLRGFTTVRDAGGPAFRPEACHRRRRGSRSAHLSLGCLHFPDWWARRLSPATRAAARRRRLSEPR